MRRAGAGESDHDHRLCDRDLEDLGVPSQQVVDEQTVRGVARAVAEHEHPSQACPFLVRVHLGQLESETFPEVGGAEVLEPGARRGRVTDRVDTQLRMRGLAVLDPHPLHLVEHRGTQVVDANHLGHRHARRVPRLSARGSRRRRRGRIRW